jgi:methylthioribose-1-phosphate isomerase
MKLPPTIAWRGGVDGHLELLDQTQLPAREVVLPIHGVEDAIAAIRRLSVRGAPAIGVAAAYALVLGVRQNAAAAADLSATVREVASRLLAARPTAVNLRWALDRCIARAAREPGLEALFAEAVAIHEDEMAMSAGIGEHGRGLVPEGGTVLTHCNTGRLATAGDGTALAVLFAAWRAGTRFCVLADETRPLLQGTRLTALELSREGIPVDVVADGAAAGLIQRGQVQMAIVGADRIARNGDFANKVGTYPLALACKANGVPFYVAAPASTFDLECADGAAIPIEERDGTEVTEFAGRRIAPPGVGARNPAFDVTGAPLVTAFVTDRGLLAPPFEPAIKEMLLRGR